MVKRMAYAFLSNKIHPNNKMTKHVPVIARTIIFFKLYNFKLDVYDSFMCSKDNNNKALSQFY
ncbi:unknown [Tannerella sp. CAG:118]|nr:unknown [Tannerella sp. CAG:118]